MLCVEQFCVGLWECVCAVCGTVSLGLGECGCSVCGTINFGFGGVSLCCVWDSLLLVLGE